MALGPLTSSFSVERNFIDDIFALKFLDKKLLLLTFYLKIYLAWAPWLVADASLNFNLVFANTCFGDVSTEDEADDDPEAFEGLGGGGGGGILAFISISSVVLSSSVVALI